MCFSLTHSFRLLTVFHCSRAEDLCNEVVDGLIAYFDRALGSILLFPFERQQYLEIIEARPDASMSETYGGEHLLRLLGTANKHTLCAKF